MCRELFYLQLHCIPNIVLTGKAHNILIPSVCLSVCLSVRSSVCWKPKFDKKNCVRPHVLVHYLYHSNLSLVMLFGSTNRIVLFTRFLRAKNVLVEGLIYNDTELLSRIRDNNLEKKKYLVNSQDTGPLPLENFYRSQINLMAATIAKIKNINQIGIVYIFKESNFFCTISVGMNCWDGSNTLLFTNKQYNCFDNLIAWYLQNHRFYPISTTDYSFFYNSKFFYRL